MPPDPHLPAFAFPRPIVGALLPQEYQPTDRALIDIRLAGGIPAFEEQIAKGIPLVRSWSDLVPMLGQLSLAASAHNWALSYRPNLDSASILWLAGHAAMVLDQPPEVGRFFVSGKETADTAWSALWKNSVLTCPVPSTHKNLPQYRSAPIHLMTSLALTFGLPCPLSPYPTVSAVHDAALILTGCLTPLQSTSASLPNLLPPSLVPRVREWLIDGLLKFPNPYSNLAWASDNSDTDLEIGRQSSRRKDKYTVGLPVGWTGTPRETLAWALDNATAIRLRQGARIGLEEFSTIDLLEDFQTRLAYWPQANAALLRTKGRTAKWPGHPAKLTFDPVDAVCATDLICVNAIPEVLIDLVRQKRLLPVPTLVAWFRRPHDDLSETGDLHRLLNSLPLLAPTRAKLVRHVLSLLGTSPLPGEHGGTLAHVFLAHYPTATSVSLLARTLGPSALLVADEQGRTPTDAARARLQMPGQGDNTQYVRLAFAGLERALLQETARAVRRSRAKLHDQEAPKKSRRL